MDDVMVDIETFGNGKHACIIQIGACYFDRKTGEIGKTFKTNIDARDAQRHGAELDADTVYWWLSQNPEAIKSILVEGGTEHLALHNLNIFLKPAKHIWSHATFDFVIISEAMKRRHIKPTFGYWSCCDIRTLMYLAKLKSSSFKREGTYHDALDDCKFQVKYCVEAMNVLSNDNS